MLQQVQLILVITDRVVHLHHKCSWTSLVFFPQALLQWCVSNAICVCHVAWTQKQTDYSSEYVAIGAAGERLCLVSCCRSGGQVAHDCHSPPLILSFSLQLSSPFFFLSFPSNALQIKLAPSHQPCQSFPPSERKRECEDVVLSYLHSSFSLFFFLILPLCPSLTDIAVLDVQSLCVLRCSYAHTLHAGASVRAWGDGEAETNRDEWHTHLRLQFEKSRDVWHVLCLWESKTHCVCLSFGFVCSC